jgi:hypothetical protein
MSPGRADLVVEVAHDRVVLEQVSKRFCICQVVNCNEVDILIAKTSTHDVAPDPTKSINANFDTHF